MEFKEVVKNFDINANLVEIRPMGNGHINSTYAVICDKEKYVLQEINTAVFKNPHVVMNNIFRVTEYLRNIIKDSGGDTSREVLNFIRTKDGSELYKTDDNKFYRMYKMVENVESYEKVEKPEHFFNAAAAFGKFQKQLADFKCDYLKTTIPKFHDTVDRMNQLEEAISEDTMDRVALCENEIKFIRERKTSIGLVLDGLRDGSIKERVTHNDTKFNNILLDSKTGKSVCIIDLDTVMPGSALYDFGDAIRFGASTAEEDERDLSLVTIDLNLFRAYVSGFLSEVRNCLTDRELELMAYSAWLMTIEVGMRFLSDFFNGDVYFKTSCKDQNLYRARNQLKLAYEMEKNMVSMNQIVEAEINKYS
ncbi:MAG: aminoglycoside phosphotransferase family protein [Oscillospiraceae bacterium]